MRTHKWLTIFTILVFGVGLTLGVIMLRIVEGSSRSLPTECPRCQGSRSSFRVHGSRVGPFVSSVQRFSEELGLNADQQTELGRIIDSVTDDITHHEQDICNLILSARRQAREILTDAQQQSLDVLLDRQWADFRRERVDRFMDWFRRKTELTDTELARVERIVRDAEEAKGRYFRRFRSIDSWPDREEMENWLETIRSGQAKELREFLDDDLVTRFEVYSRHGSRRRAADR